MPIIGYALCKDGLALFLNNLVKEFSLYFSIQATLIYL